MSIIEDIICGEDMSSVLAKWNAIIAKVNAGVSLSETFIDGESFNIQKPSVVDSKLQIEFGAAQGSALDPVMMDANGTVTCNEAGLYLFNAQGTFGREGSTGESEMRFALELNGVQEGKVLAVKLDNVRIQAPIDTTFTLNLNIGDELKFYILRDSTGHNSGGLFPSVTTIAGWKDSSSARITVERLS